MIVAYEEPRGDEGPRESVCSSMNQMNTRHRTEGYGSYSTENRQFRSHLCEAMLPGRLPTGRCESLVDLVGAQIIVTFHQNAEALELVFLSAPRPVISI